MENGCILKVATIGGRPIFHFHAGGPCGWSLGIAGAIALATSRGSWTGANSWRGCGSTRAMYCVYNVDLYIIYIYIHNIYTCLSLKYRDSIKGGLQSCRVCPMELTTLQFSTFAGHYALENEWACIFHALTQCSLLIFCDIVCFVHSHTASMSSLPWSWALRRAFARPKKRWQLPPRRVLFAGWTSTSMTCPQKWRVARNPWNYQAYF